MPRLLASLQQLEDRLGSSFSVTERLRAEAALDDASELVLELGDDTWTADTVPGRARAIVLQSARRTMKNPDGVAQTSIGDVSVSYSRSGIQGAVYLTKDEHRAIRRLAGRLSGSVTLVTPYSGDEESDDA